MDSIDFNKQVQASLEVTPLTMDEMAALKKGAASVLKTETVPVVISGEALLGIEGLARCVAGPGRSFVNLVCGPYGKEFGVWLRECGSTVTDVETGWNEVLRAEHVREVLERVRPDALSYVYAEAVTGGANPVFEIQKIAKEYGIYTILDAVSSIGADPFSMDAWGVDFVAMGMQKALMGSNGISFLGISGRGMDWIRHNPYAPKHTVLSIPEISDRQQEEVPADLSWLEARQALHAFAKIDRMGGVDALAGRHQRLARAMRREIRQMGLSLYQSREADCSDLNTVICLPKTEAAAAFRGEGIVACGDFALKGQALRINHYGVHCTGEDLQEALRIIQKLQNK